MSVTRDVIRDLLPAYVAGEASADTRSLVEEWLGRDPELKAEAQTARAAVQRIVAARTPPPPPGQERAALEAVRRLVARRSWLRGLASFLTLLPFCFAYTFGGGGLRFLLLRDAPQIAAASLCGAALCWVALWRNHRRLRVTGL